MGCTVHFITDSDCPGCQGRLTRKTIEREHARDRALAMELQSSTSNPGTSTRTYEERDGVASKPRSVREMVGDALSGVVVLAVVVAAPVAVYAGLNLLQAMPDIWARWWWLNLPLAVVLGIHLGTRHWLPAYLALGPLAALSAFVIMLQVGWLATAMVFFLLSGYLNSRGIGPAVLGLSIALVMAAGTLIVASFAAMRVVAGGGRAELPDGTERQEHSAP